MKFPLQKGASKKGLGVRIGQCSVCRKSGVGEPNGFAWVNGGALFAISKSTATMDDRIRAFFAIGYHGAHNEERVECGANLEIVRDPVLGQFEFYFCSTACMRRFFNDCVDELEQRIKAGRQKKQLTKRSSGRAKTHAAERKRSAI